MEAPFGITWVIAFRMTSPFTQFPPPPLKKRHIYSLHRAMVVLGFVSLASSLAYGMLLRAEGVVSPNSQEKVFRPFPQAGEFSLHGVFPDSKLQSQLNKTIRDFYAYWKSKYLLPSVRVPGDYKVKYDRKGRTVSEAMGYGMMLAAYMAGSDPEAKRLFDGLDGFRKRFPSKINPSFMNWQIPSDENPHRNDCATDGELDMAFALLLAHEQWGDPRYLEEAKSLIHDIGISLVRPDGSLRLGDWNEETGQTRPSDFMPTHFRAFQKATGDELWNKVEATSYVILNQLQSQFSSNTGLIPDFSIEQNGRWIPAKPKFLEGPHDGEFYYNACRIPWRIGWAASTFDDPRAVNVLKPFMTWADSTIKEPDAFRAGYRLDGSDAKGNDFDTACFIAPTGVAASALGNKTWLNGALAYCTNKREEYFEDSINLLSLLVMSGNAWIPLGHGPRRPGS